MCHVIWCDQMIKSLWTYYQSCILDSQRQTQQPCTNVPLQQVDKSLKKTRGGKVTCALEQSQLHFQTI